MQGLYYTLAAVIALGMIMTTLVVVTSIAIKHKKDQIPPPPEPEQPGFFASIVAAVSESIRQTKAAYKQGIAEAEAAAQGIPPPIYANPKTPSLYEQALANAKALYGDNIPPNVSRLLDDLKKAEESKNA